jgi:plastocyanin domain-containing protein
MKCRSRSLKHAIRAALTSHSYQEAMVLVKGDYTPDVIIVKHGIPAQLTFHREEMAASSEMVIFNDFGKSVQ